MAPPAIRFGEDQGSVCPQGARWIRRRQTAKLSVCANAVIFKCAERFHSLETGFSIAPISRRIRSTED